MQNNQDDPVLQNYLLRIMEWRDTVTISFLFHVSTFIMKPIVTKFLPNLLSLNSKKQKCPEICTVNFLEIAIRSWN